MQGKNPTDKFGNNDKKTTYGKKREDIIQDDIGADKKTTYGKTKKDIIQDDIGAEKKTTYGKTREDTIQADTKQDKKMNDKEQAKFKDSLKVNIKNPQGKQEKKKKKKVKLSKKKWKFWVGAGMLITLGSIAASWGYQKGKNSWDKVYERIEQIKEVDKLLGNDDYER